MIPTRRCPWAPAFDRHGRRRRTLLGWLGRWEHARAGGF